MVTYWSRSARVCSWCRPRACRTSWHRFPTVQTLEKYTGCSPPWQPTKDPQLEKKPPRGKKKKRSSNQTEELVTPWTRSNSPRAVDELDVAELHGARNKANARSAGDHGQSLLDFILPLVYGEETFSDGCMKVRPESSEPTERRINDEGNGGIHPHVGHGVPVLLKPPQIQTIPSISRCF